MNREIKFRAWDGKEIYEGDKFILENSLSNYIKVIGNIYENKELLE